MMSMRKLALSVRLTARQIEASPDISEDEPVSKRMENHLYDYYSWIFLGHKLFRHERDRYVAIPAAFSGRVLGARGG